MSLKYLRKKKHLSQEQLAEYAGLSLRTIQRIEQGKRVSGASLQALAAYLNSNVDALYSDDTSEGVRSVIEHIRHITVHSSMQIIILFITYFIFVSQWLAYFTPVAPYASLGTILLYLLQMSAVFTLFAYVFYTAKKILISTYYITASLFGLTAIALDIWTQGLADSASFALFFPVYFTLMLLSLFAIHTIQLALSLKSEAATTLLSQ